MNIRSIPKPILLLAMVLLSFSVTEILIHTTIFERLEFWSFDARTQAVRQDKSIDDDVAVVLIDESSLRSLEPAYGRFPWPRSAYAELLDFLALGKPKAVVFDLLFSERQMASVDQEESPDDAEFIRATDRHPYVIHAAQLFHDETLKYLQAASLQTLPQQFVEKFGIPVAERDKHANNSFVIPMPGLWHSAAGIGIVNMGPDVDGVYRRVPLYQYYDGFAYPSLSISPLLDTASPPSLPGDTKTWLDPGKGNAYVVNMYGNYHPYSISGLFASWNSLQNGEVEKMLVNPQEFRDKYVFIGASAVGLEDIKSTAISQISPGVFIHASILSNLIAGDILTHVPNQYAVALGLLLSVIALLFILNSHRWYLGYMFPVLAILAYVYVAFALFSHNYVISIVEPVLLVLVSILIGSGYKAVTEGKDRRRVKHMFSQYVSNAVLDELLEKYEDHIRAGDGTRQKVTILFSDIRDFTSLSEKLSPEKVVELLNIYLGEMSSIIMKEGGTIDKFIGDAIMAFWGAPIITDDHADKALISCMEMVGALESVNKRLREKGFDNLKVGIGLHTGYAILGNIGSENKLDYTVIGDTVNLASRVEGLTKQYGFPILLTEDSRNALSMDIPLGIVDAVRVKGKNIPIKLYAIPVDSNGRMLQGDAAIAEKELMEQGFTRYLARDWAAAIEWYGKLKNPVLSDKYISRCEHYLEQPPADGWDGVFIHTSK